MKTQDKTGQGASRGQRPVRGRRNSAKGRVVEPGLLHEIETLCAGLSPRKDMLIEHLHRLQDHLGQLPAPYLAALAHHLRLSQADVFEVASFYHHFDCVPEGAAPAAPLTVRVCESISCELQGAKALASTLAESPDLRMRGVRIQRVPCIGRCAQAPAAVIGLQAVAPASPEGVIRSIVQGQSRGTTEAWPVPALAQALDRGDYRRLQAAWSGALQRKTILDQIEQAGVRGMGGAGFSTSRKWRTVSEQVGPRLMAINADEGEPGTFKDRHWFEQAAHRILEGALIAAWTVRVDAIWLYLRDEYAELRLALEGLWPEIQAWIDRHWDWQDGPPREAPRLHLRRGAGAYVCGEESAMIASIEGLRGLPRLRPPYVAQRGLFGRPTLVNNPETLMWVSRILEHGPRHFAEQGRRGRSGLRSFSVSGRVNQPGVKLAPAGISLRELIDEYCAGMPEGHTLYGYLPGGASGGILPASLADEPLDFETLAAHGAFIGSHAIVVLSQHDLASDVARNLMHFFRHESCGQCTPCRAGTVQMARLIAEPEWSESALHALEQVMRDASICGLGQAAPNPVASVLRFFPQEVTGGSR
ncbi:MAG: NADH-ubiquinone oxidoreductase-F iron-sulfur binding region domain-containing protein [Burkholderiaceae bacterium]